MLPQTCRASFHPLCVVAFPRPTRIMQPVQVLLLCCLPPALCSAEELLHASAKVEPILEEAAAAADAAADASAAADAKVGMISFLHTSFTPPVGVTSLDAVVELNPR